MDYPTTLFIHWLVLRAVRRHAAEANGTDRWKVPRDVIKLMTFFGVAFHRLCELCTKTKTKKTRLQKRSETRVGGFALVAVQQTVLPTPLPPIYKSLDVLFFFLVFTRHRGTVDPKPCRGARLVGLVWAAIDSWP